jgi:hypothetical protein
MTHLVLASDVVAGGMAGRETFRLLVGSNIAELVTSGGCCGQGVLAVIRAP